MPDESCRSCGGDLRSHLQCEECRKPVQKVCQACNALTRKQFHAGCERGGMPLSPTLQKGVNQCILETVENGHARRIFPVRPFALMVGTAAFLVLYIAFATYPDLLQTHAAETGIVDQEDVPAPQARYDVVPRDIMQNCLAYGSGESVTVTCPTEQGYVYKAILEMPKDLAARFSDAVFSIRGVSVAENSDGTVALKYENANYVTTFFAS